MRSSFDLLILMWHGHIETAAHAIEQWKRVEEEFGPTPAYLGYSPVGASQAPPAGEQGLYQHSHYWQRYVRIPFFSRTIGDSKWTRVGSLVKALASSVASIAWAAPKLLLGRTDGFFESIRNAKVRGLQIGPAIYSDYLRNDRHSAGLLKLDTNFLRTLFECHRYLHYWLDVCPDRDFSRVLFSNPETTYRLEIARLALLSRGAREIFLQRWCEPKFSVWSSHKEGWELSLVDPPAEEIDADRIQEAKREVGRRLSGQAKYVYMHTDVSSDVKPIVEPRVIEGRPAAVVYLHVVSDAQHAFGPDCFNDLHHWLETSIKLLRAHDYSVLLKLHPLYLKPNCVGDVRYKARLEKWLGVSWNDLAVGEVRPSAVPHVALVDYRVGIEPLRASLGPFLCVTHHGVVATEAIAAGIATVRSKAGPYRYFPDFAFSYESIPEYDAFLRAFREGNLAVTAEMQKNLYSYLAATRGDSWRFQWEIYDRILGASFFENQQAMFTRLCESHPGDEHADTLRSLFGGKRPVVNFDGSDWIRRHRSGPAEP